MGWRRFLLQGNGHAHHVLPLFLNDGQISSFGEQIVEVTVIDGFVDTVELLILQIPNTRHKVEAEQMAKRENDFRLSVGIGGMFPYFQDGVVF